MIFNSLSFLLFFPITTAIYFLLPRSLRWVHLLLVSCLFYAALIPVYLFILFAIILLDYITAILIAPSRGKTRLGLLIVSLAANIGVLAIFKYFNFASDNLAHIASLIHWNYPVRHLGFLLPVGLSFHTFQSMAYSIEVYRGRQKPEKHLGIYALYVMFYPQLVAGPIERPQHLLPQLRRGHNFDADRVFSGLKQMLWGLFKKLVVADRLAAIVDATYAHPAQTGGGPLILATWLFAVQIYCDFSGYSDMAIGAARVLGISLAQNFNRPYASQSIAEFWHRWHISLSTWFRDYVYIPLGGSRVTFPRWCFSIMVVFLISGLWHGAGWTFAIWGALHGLFLIASRLIEGSRSKVALRRSAIDRIWRTVLTFNLVSFAWIFFRAPTIADAGIILRRMVSSGFWHGPPLPAVAIGSPAYTSSGLNIAIILSVMLFLAEWLYARHRRLEAPLPAVWVRWLGYYALIALILWIGAFGGKTFIYYQF